MHLGVAGQVDIVFVLLPQLRVARLIDVAGVTSLEKCLGPADVRSEGRDSLTVCIVWVALKYGSDNAWGCVQGFEIRPRPNDRLGRLGFALFRLDPAAGLRV